MSPVARGAQGGEAAGGPVDGRPAAAVRHAAHQVCGGHAVAVGSAAGERRQGRAAGTAAGVDVRNRMKRRGLSDGQLFRASTLLVKDSLSAQISKINRALKENYLD